MRPPGDFFIREAARSQPRPKINIDAIERGAPRNHRRQPTAENGYYPDVVFGGNVAAPIIFRPDPPVRQYQQQAEAREHLKNARPTKRRACQPADWGAKRQGQKEPGYDECQPSGAPTGRGQAGNQSIERG
jgi:hypothetical protein